MPIHTLASNETMHLVCWAYGIPEVTLHGMSENRGIGANPAPGTRITIPPQYATPTMSISPGRGTLSLQQGRIQYIQMAYQRAFGQNVREFSWNTNLTWSQMRPTLGRLYRYYGATYLRRPDLFLWAGLGKLAGAAVIKGMDTADWGLTEDDIMFRILCRIAKEIFWDVAWLHEAAADDPAGARTLATFYDARQRRVRSDGSVIPAAYAQRMRSSVHVDIQRYRHRFGEYGRAIDHMINPPDADGIKYGNLAMLANEQWVNIQPWYDYLNQNGRQTALSQAGGMTRNVHPYHNDFVVDAGGNISHAPDRWRWINDVPNAMWPMWTFISEDERTRLVNLSLQQLMDRDWGPTAPQYEPPGTRY